LAAQKFRGDYLGIPVVKRLGQRLLRHTLRGLPVANDNHGLALYSGAD
jgi:hypothetical protein